MPQFTFEKTKIPGVIVVTPKVFGDKRGYLMETYQKDLFEEGGIPAEFVQENESYSTKGVLRGLHFQTRHPQGKLVRVVYGKVFDVAVDCRPDSPAFGKWTGVVLDASIKNMFYLPKGLAHGFLVLSDTAQFTYLCDDYYDPDGEGGIPYDDPDINVEWPETDAPLNTSAKDKEHIPFKDQKFEWFKGL